MINENAKENDIADLFGLEELENKLAFQLSEFEYLEKEKAKIDNPEELGKTIMNVVWEQFVNQIAVTAGEDFIKENGGLTLDLRNDAHIQTTENFENGKLAKHNKEINYEERHSDWTNNFHYDENDNIKTSNDGKKVLTKEARHAYDNGRDKGSSTRV